MSKKTLHYNDNEIGEFRVISKLPKTKGMVYYTYATSTPVPATDLGFNICEGFRLVVLEGDRAGDALKMLKLAVYHGSALLHNGGELYPMAVGYMEKDEAGNGSPLIVVATVEEE
jgi:hypothetical protein